MRAARFDSVDQLRGAAALAVVVCHLSVSAYVDVPSAGEPGWPWLGLVLGIGYVGVPLFFVISGFCIHLPQARARAGDAGARPDWRQFFRRRFWRLYPPYAASIAVAFGLTMLLGREHSGVIGDLLSHLALVQTLIPRYFDGLNPPAWTLAVETQFYLAYPIVFLLFRRFGSWRGLAIVLAVTLAYRIGLNFSPLPAANNSVLWEFFLARWFEWTCGALVAEWIAGNARLPWPLPSFACAAALLSLAVWSEWHAWHYQVYLFRELLYGAGFACLLGATVGRDRDASTALGRYLKAVGTYSYSLYLLHRPIQFAFEPVAARVASLPFVVRSGVPSSLLIMAATTPFVLWASRVFHRWVEAPFLERGRRSRQGDRVVVPPAAEKAA